MESLVKSVQRLRLERDAVSEPGRKGVREGGRYSTSLGRFWDAY